MIKHTSKVITVTGKHCTELLTKKQIWICVCNHPIELSEKDTNLCIEFTAVDCHCAGRPFLREYHSSSAALGQEHSEITTASRSHQATTCTWLVDNFQSAVWCLSSLCSKYRGKVRAGGEYTNTWVQWQWKTWLDLARHVRTRTYEHMYILFMHTYTSGMYTYSVCLLHCGPYVWVHHGSSDSRIPMTLVCVFPTLLHPAHMMTYEWPHTTLLADTEVRNVIDMGCFPEVKYDIMG